MLGGHHDTVRGFFRNSRASADMPSDDSANTKLVMCLRSSSTTSGSFKLSRGPCEDREGARERDVEDVRGTGAGEVLDRRNVPLTLCRSISPVPANGMTFSLINFATDANFPIIGAGNSSVARKCVTLECDG